MVSGQAIHDRARALGIAPAEEAAAGGGEAEAQGDAKIDVGWITHDAVVYGPDCLEEHGKEDRSLRSSWPGERLSEWCWCWYRRSSGSKEGSAAGRDSLRSCLRKPAP